MSLVRIALRFAAVQALKGRTLVGDNVLDSEIGVIDINADGALDINKEKNRPFIAVYSDASLTGGTETDLRSLTQNGDIELIFETGVTAAMVDIDDDGRSLLIGLGIPDTDRAMEQQLDLVVRQIFVALTDPSNEWAQIVLQLTRQFTQVRRGRVSTGENGLRRAAQQITLKASLIADPVWGADITLQSAFGRFMAKLEAMPEKENIRLAQMLREHIGTRGDDVDINQRRYGLTFDEMNAMLLAVPSEALP